MRAIGAPTAGSTVDDFDHESPILAAMVGRFAGGGLAADTPPGIVLAVRGNRAVRQLGRVRGQLAERVIAFENTEHWHSETNRPVPTDATSRTKTRGERLA